MRTDDERQSEAHHRAYWHSRRGMLELEFQLLPFVRDCFGGLCVADQQTYVALLAHEDWEIFDWLQGREQPADPALRRMVEEIISHNTKPRRSV
jgi:antitoxin CptB